MARTSLKKVTSGTAIALAGNLAKGVPPDLPEDVAKYWNGHCAKLHARMAAVLRSDALGSPVPDNPYAEEQTPKLRFYPDGFADTSRQTTLETQAERIRKALGFEPKGLEAAQSQSFPTGAFGADGIGLWPTRQALGRHFGIKYPRGRDYGTLIEALCSAINASPDLPPLTNYCQGELTDKHVRVEKATNQLLTHLEDEVERQGREWIAGPANFGDWRTGFCYSPRNALWHTLNWSPKRLAIEPVAGLCLLIANPGRFTASGQLSLDFPGAQYNGRGGGRWSYSPYLYFGDGKFHFYACESDCASGCSGSLVAFPGV